MTDERNRFRQCTKEELDSFLRDYDGDLKADVSQMFDPPLCTYNDFSDGKIWPESIVAQVVLGSDRGDPDTYWLRARRAP